MGSAAPIIITVVAVVASVYAGPMVGAAIMESMGVVGASAAATAAVGAAAIGGSTSAVNAAIAGKNVEGVLKAGAIGAASSAAASGVSSAIGGAFGPDGLPTGQAGPPTPFNSATKIAQGTGYGATSGFTRAQLSGQNLDQSGKQAAIGGVTGAATAAIGEGLQGAGVSPEDARLASTLSGPYIAQDVSGYFAPQRSSGTTGSDGQSTQLVGTSPTTGQGAPGSSALGQALRIGSGEPGALIESPGGGETTSKPVWNLASLRVKDETGSES